MSSVYVGRPPHTVVIVDDEANTEVKLPLRLDLANHSPTGFAWGYGGSGPSQLALALCAHALGDPARARRVYQEFKWQVVCKLAPDAIWRFEASEVVRVCENIERKQAVKA